MEENLGFCQGEICNRDGCKGVITENSRDEGCSCHINPPCSSCCNTSQHCNECGWDNDEEYRYQELLKKMKKDNNSELKIEEVYKHKYDENKVYSIFKYFDDHFEGIVAKNLSEKEAYDRAFELGRNTVYVSYSVRKQVHEESN